MDITLSQNDPLGAACGGMARNARKGVVTWLATYCFYAAIYGRSPVGLAVPSTLQGQVTAEHEEKLNRLLQEIAWEAVMNEPLTGVKK